MLFHLLLLPTLQRQAQPIKHKLQSINVMGGMARPKTKSRLAHFHSQRTFQLQLRRLYSSTSSPLHMFSASKNHPWISLQVDPRELRPSLTLVTGQSFRWRPLGKDFPGEYIGVVGNNAYIIKEAESDTWYRVLRPTQNVDGKNAEEDTNHDVILRDYFRLRSSTTNATISLVDLHEEFGKKDLHFAKVASRDDLSGARVLRQAPLECLVSFICSSNNNIARISKMVEALCINYGTQLDIEVEGKTLFAFPTLEQLRNATENDLRDLGFGYRAKYIVGAVDKINRNGGESQLYSLRSASREDAHKYLTSLPGVGAKVASCVCLFALDCDDDVPIDTHVWQIAKRDYQLGLDGKSLTPKIYKNIGDFFRKRFGEYAGWAHHLLFIADLKEFKR
mmetsp:Transcript_31522/g.76913  ORF Transcript_31522/g.76913 Transcript_31522/m.76913 type:complete len:392 (-) Transcript_31522:48-1223(-)